MISWMNRALSVSIFKTFYDVQLYIIWEFLLIHSFSIFQAVVVFNANSLRCFCNINVYVINNHEDG